MAIPFITASTLVAAACALPFASTAHSEVATVPIPKSICNLPTERSLIIWHRAPGVEDRAEALDESDLTNCRPWLDELRGPALGPSGPGYCSKISLPFHYRTLTGAHFVFSADRFRLLGVSSS